MQNIDQVYIHSLHFSNWKSSLGCKVLIGKKYSEIAHLVVKQSFHDSAQLKLKLKSDKIQIFFWIAPEMEKCACKDIHSVQPKGNKVGDIVWRRGMELLFTS